jgi:hypothetical protein
MHAAGHAWESALDAHALAPPDARFPGRLRALSSAAAELSSLVDRRQAHRRDDRSRYNPASSPPSCTTEMRTARADGAVVLAPTATGVSRVIKFHDPALVLVFGFPDVLAD